MAIRSLAGVDEGVPRILMRYRPIEPFARLLTEIRGSLWLSAAEHLNDPFDGLWNVGESEVDVTKLSTDLSIAGGKDAQFRVTGKNQALIACLTERWDSLAMWAHYSSGGQGICLGLRTDLIAMDLDFHSQPHVRSIGVIRPPLIRPVQYVDDLSSPSSGIDAAFQKQRQWDSEKEWRIVLEVFRGRFRPTEESVDQPRELPRVKGRSIAHNAIRDITVGWRTKHDERREITDLVFRLQEAGHKLNLLYTFLDRRRQSLVRRRIAPFIWRNSEKELSKVALGAATVRDFDEMNQSLAIGRRRRHATGA